MNSNSNPNDRFAYHRAFSLSGEDMPDDDTEADITRYESMPLEDVNEELRLAGINPSRTLEAVRKLIRQRFGG